MVQALYAVGGAENPTKLAEQWISEHTIESLRKDWNRPEKRVACGDRAARGLGVVKRQGANGPLFHFDFACKLQGKSIKLRLGNYPVLSIDGAREQVRKLRSELERGRDPRLVRAAEEAASKEAEEMTLRKAYELKLASGIRPNTQSNYHTSVNRSTILVMLGVFLCSLNANAEGTFADYPPQKDMKGHLVTTYDPGYVRIKLTDGSVIDAPYEGIDWQEIDAWETQSRETGEARRLALAYKPDLGVSVTDIASGKSFVLIGRIDPHPIDFALKACRHDEESTQGIVECLDMAAEAWTKEIERSYSLMQDDGAKGVTQAAQAWRINHAAHVKILRTFPALQKGSISRILSVEHVVSLRRSHALWLAGVRVW